MPADSRSSAYAGTAHWIAAARARETERQDRLFADPYAAVLAGPIGRAALTASERASGSENVFLPIRTRFFDDLLVAEAPRLDQVVLLGAGLDTRPFRLTLPAALRWFEIDRAELFAEKEPILGALGVVAGCQRTVVAADLTGAWSPALLDAGFQASQRTAWIAEGLCFYLSGDAVRDLMSETRRLAGGGSLIAADVFGSGLLSLPGMRTYLAGRAERGLPPPFTTDNPVETLHDAGWPSVELALPGPLGRTYGPAIEHAKQRTAAPDPTMRSYLVVARAVAEAA